MSRTNGDVPVYELVKAARLARDWSQRQVAEAAGVKQPVVSNLENGRTVNDEVLRRILAVLEISGESGGAEPRSSTDHQASPER